MWQASGNNRATESHNELRIYENNSSANIKVSGEGGGESTSGDETEIPLQPMEVPVGADVENSTLEQVDACEEAVNLWESCTGTDCMKDLWNCVERSPQQTTLASRTSNSVESPPWSSLLLKDCTLWKGLMLEQSVKS